ncbi:hypothetical protein ZIOFF_048010 [Zingiber officinale]|uniref:Deoxyuridine 5'-triphosphate nucleotidohydrolase n=1 Tax=Zingiber officinale TaxID=94328 RepID=A0A8J5KRQ4_ZINOF|nr:hypothetical protein ZIOFF_048010 [Zingiber officinale]
MSSDWVSETSQLTDDIANLNISQDIEEQEAAHVNTTQLQALEQLEYPILRRLMQNTKEKAFTSTSDSAISNYKQPNEPLMGQINYPPAQGTTPQFPDNGQYKGKFKGKSMEHQTWTLPSAQQNTRAMLVLPDDIGIYAFLSGEGKEGGNIQFSQGQKINTTAKILERRTEGTAGYDLFIDQDIEIPAKDRRLAKTRISIEFPEGHYARVTTRSGAAIRLKIDIGVGVIDANYRGEIQLLVINHSNNVISLEAGDSIAQFILEKIITPQIEEVDFLSTTT